MHRAVSALLGHGSFRARRFAIRGEFADVRSRRELIWALQ